MLTGLRTRTIVLVIALVAIGGVGYMSYTLTSQRRQAEEALRSRLEDSMRAFAIPCALAIANDRVDTLDTLVAAVAERADALDLLELTIVDHTGRVLADSRVERFGQTLVDDFTGLALRSSGLVWRVVGNRAFVGYPITSGLRWGTLRATVSLDPLQARMAQRRRDLALFFALGASALGIALVLLLGALVVNPVADLAATAQRLGRGEHSARVGRYRRDEIGALGRAFDEMAERIARHTGELENKVTERTVQLTEANTRLETVNRKLEQLAITDGLTALFNHRYFQERLALELKRGSRTPHGFAVVMIDVDHFKHYNDSHGHPAGDEVLRGLALLLRENLRETDVVARYGGEEFVAMLLDSEPEAGLATAEKLRTLVAAHPFVHDAEQPGGALTISVGVAFYPRDGSSPDSLIAAADRALYVSKKAGRNRVSVSEEVS